MRFQRELAIAAIAAACSIGWVDANAADADAEPPNPPRSQQKIMKERYAACRDLHGDALADCMASYVGTPEKNLESNEGAQYGSPNTHSGTASKQGDLNQAPAAGTGK